MIQDLVPHCAELYQTAFEQLTRQKLKETDAQRIAIATVFEKLVIELGINRSNELWKAIHAAHVFRKSGIISVDVIEKVTSAAQSWAKSSGHAFEQSICSLLNKLTNEFSIELVLQKNVKLLLDQQAISNPQRDIRTVLGWIKTSAFDIFALHKESDGSLKIFGCIQCKTSVRERVTRDREPSLQAMQSFFWSSAIVLDGEFLNLPKFIEMVDGGSETYPINGWHGAYVFADVKNSERIFKLDNEFDPLVRHLQEARDHWLSNRQWLDKNWLAKNS